MLVRWYLLYYTRECFFNNVVLILVAAVEGVGIKPVVPSEGKAVREAAPTLIKESSVDPDPQP